MLQLCQLLDAISKRHKMFIFRSNMNLPVAEIQANYELRTRQQQVGYIHITLGLVWNHFAKLGATTLSTLSLQDKTHWAIKQSAVTNQDKQNLR